jgi:hypothetical protein
MVIKSCTFEFANIFSRQRENIRRNLNIRIHWEVTGLLDPSERIHPGVRAFWQLRCGFGGKVDIQTSTSLN